jgi:hypothetical protein
LATSVICAWAVVLARPALRTGAVPAARVVLGTGTVRGARTVFGGGTITIASGLIVRVGQVTGCGIGLAAATAAAPLAPISPSGS